MSQIVTISTSTIPAGFCFSTWAQSWPELVSLLTGSLAGDTVTFNYGKTAPAPEDQGNPWFRLNADGSPDRWYAFWNGVWCAKIHPYDLNERRVYTGTPAQIWAYDGGSGDNPITIPPTLTSGATWEADTAFDARFPLGVGTMPSSAVITLGQQSGEELHVLTVDELPAHTHITKITDRTSVGGMNSLDYNTGTFGTTSDWLSEPTGGGLGHNNLPPFYGVYFIKRTARQFYTV